MYSGISSTSVRCLWEVDKYVCLFCHLILFCVSRLCLLTLMLQVHLHEPVSNCFMRDLLRNPCMCLDVVKLCEPLKCMKWSLCIYSTRWLCWCPQLCRTASRCRHCCCSFREYIRATTKLLRLWEENAAWWLIDDQLFNFAGSNSFCEPPPPPNICYLIITVNLL